MITTNNYILDQDMIEPVTYRNHNFSKVTRTIRSTIFTDYRSHIYYLNKKGQIDRIERVDGRWQAYPPGSKPERPEISIVDYLEYDDHDRLITIDTRFIHKDLELVKVEYGYEDDLLMQIKKTARNGAINYTIYEYDKTHLVKVESSNDIEGKKNILDTTSYRWNEHDQIIEKNRTSILDFENIPAMKQTQSSVFSYNESNQLRDAKTYHNIKEQSSESISTFRYLNSVSDQLAEIQQLENGALHYTRKFSIDKKENVITERIKMQKNKESVIEYRGYV